jgi:hypothetical protein
MNSRNKGKRGELEAAKFLASEGFPARRGQQFSGGTDSPDVLCEALPRIHFEVKRTEKGNPTIGSPRPNAMPATKSLLCSTGAMITNGWRFCLPNNFCGLSVKAPLSIRRPQNTMKAKSFTKKALNQRKKLIKRYLDLRINEGYFREKIHDFKHFLKINIMESKECMRQIEELDNSIPPDKPNQQKETET